MAINKAIFQQRQSIRWDEMYGHSMSGIELKRCEILRDLNFRGIIRKDEAIDAPHLNRGQINWLNNHLIQYVGLIKNFIDEAAARIATSSENDRRLHHEEEIQGLSFREKTYLEFCLLDNFGIII